MGRFSWQREGAGRAKLVQCPRCPRCDGRLGCKVCGGEGLALRSDAERWLATEEQAAEWEEARSEDLNALLDYMMDLREPTLAEERKLQKVEREAQVPWLVADERARAYLEELAETPER